jgi:hypothetical protein
MRMRYSTSYADLTRTQATRYGNTFQQHPAYSLGSPQQLQVLTWSNAGQHWPIYEMLSADHITSKMLSQQTGGYPPCYHTFKIGHLQSYFRTVHRARYSAIFFSAVLVLRTDLLGRAIIGIVNRIINLKYR